MAVATVMATGASYLSSTWLLAGVIDVSSGQPFRQVWAERFRWLWPYYWGLGMLAFALIFSFQTAGLIGVIATLAPLLVLRFGQVQYIAHTQSLVSQLRQTNTELRSKSGEIARLNEELLLALSRTIDLRVPEVQDHSLNVARYAMLIASEMKLPPERIEMVRKAALLHDIGKLGIPESILLKPASLTPIEYELVKRHATMGADIVAACHSLNALVPLVRHHHEHYDGRGYPAGLKDHEIPVEARIISLADAVEAMAVDRPYRQAMPSGTILAEIQRHAGSQFDPDVVDAFLQVVREQGESVIVSLPGGDRGQTSPEASEAKPGIQKPPTSHRFISRRRLDVRHPQANV
jgi:putative nucleotidyltransferase with HDIG domain